MVIYQICQYFHLQKFPSIWYKVASYIIYSVFLEYLKFRLKLFAYSWYTVLPDSYIFRTPAEIKNIQYD